jgi:hypothetical protein
MLNLQGEDFRDLGTSITFHVVWILSFLGVLKHTAPFHDRPDAEQSATLAIARSPSSLIGEC